MLPDPALGPSHRRLTGATPEYLTF